LEEDRIFPDGSREAIRRVDDHGYRPTQRTYFQAAVAKRDLVWTEPYEFYAGGGLGITCAAPLLDAKGNVRGVFTVDFLLDRLAGTLEDLRVSKHGRVFIATGQGTILVGRRVAVARWIASPLRELADVARRIRHGQLDVTIAPRSRDEIGVLARAMGDMVHALRDRDFVRETFGRYVSPELAERALRDRGALRL